MASDKASAPPFLAASAALILVFAAPPEARADAPAFDDLFGLRPGATSYDLERALGSPDRIEPGDDPVLRFAIHPVDPGEALPATLDVTICGDTGRVCRFAVDSREAGLHFERWAAVFGVLGLESAELIARLGPATPDRWGSLTWRSRGSPGASPARVSPNGAATLEVMVGSDGRATRLSITWSVPTWPAPDRARLASFARFAGLKRGDREDRVRVVFGAPDSVRVDARSDQRRLEYSGLTVGIDRRTDLVAFISFGPRAASFLAARGLDDSDPGLWVLGKSPAHLRRHFGKPTQAVPETWPWPSARSPQGQLAVICGAGVVPTCDGAIVSWFVSTPSAPLGKLDVSGFSRLGPLEHGDLEADVVRKLGPPSRVEALAQGGGRSLDFGDGALSVLVDANGRAELLLIGPGTGPWLADRGQADPRLALVGRKRAEVVRALGRPIPDSSFENPSWSTPYGSSPRVRLLAHCYDFDRGHCNSFSLGW